MKALIKGGIDIGLEKSYKFYRHQEDFVKL